MVYAWEGYGVYLVVLILMGINTKGGYHGYVYTVDGDQQQGVGSMPKGGYHGYGVYLVGIGIDVDQFSTN